MASTTKKHWAITPTALTELINKKRRELNKTPIDHGTIMTRLILKSNVYHPGVFDFEAHTLTLDRNKLALLEELLHDQFGLHMENQLVRYFKSLSTMDEKTKSQPIQQQRHTPTEQKKGGFMSKLKHLLK